MNSRQRIIVEVTLQKLLELSWTERVEVLHAINNNKIFCPNCGYGSKENPNPDCQCNNDE